MTFTKSHFLKILIAISASISSQSFAGIKEGGGGNVVVCFNSSAQKDKVQKQSGAIKDADLKNIESIDLLEIYDMKKKRSPLSERTLVQIKTSNAASEASSLFEYYKKNIIFTNADFIGLNDSFAAVMKALGNPRDFTNEPLRRLYDSNEVINYDAQGRCLLSTLAIQRGDQNFFELSIDGRLWNHPAFSTLNKVALIFHETFYKVARDKGLSDSLSAQRINQLFLSTTENETKTDWSDQVSRYGLIYAQSPDSQYAKMLYERCPASIFLGYPKGFSISENVSAQDYGDLKKSIQMEVVDTKRCLNKITPQYAVCPDLVTKVNTILDGFSSLNEKTHNNYVEAELGYQLGETIQNYPSGFISKRFSNISCFDHFEKN